ncbi:MAG TPA: hypothetical protein VKB63_07240 [Gemmatimonadales bacterium]|nr:hypothetical protein [Gemmatimonadales bacterium]
MPSDRALRWSAFAFGLFFALVVALGYIPSFNGGEGHVAMAANGEHQMFGLYMIGTADDVTHGLTAVLFLAAALTSARASRIALLVFGCYYAVDAAIYLVTGVIQQRPVVSNMLLNLPHVVISGIMLTLALRGRRALLAA